MKTRVAILSLVALCFAAGPALGDMFTLNKDAAMKLWPVFFNPDDQPATQLYELGGAGSEVYATDDETVYGETMLGQAGFVGVLQDSTLTNQYTPFAQMGIGANFWGSSSSTGATGATTAEVIGAALGTAPTNDLSGFDGYELWIANDNDDIWWVNVFMNTGFTDDPFNEPDNYYENGWVAINPGQSTTVTLDFSAVGAVNLDHVTNIGFNLGGRMGTGSGNPSNPDIFHVSVVPVPGAVLLGLLGLSAAGIKLRKRV